MLRRGAHPRRRHAGGGLTWANSTPPCWRKPRPCERRASSTVRATAGRGSSASCAIRSACSGAAKGAASRGAEQAAGGLLPTGRQGDHAHRGRPRRGLLGLRRARHGEPDDGQARDRRAHRGHQVDGGARDGEPGRHRQGVGDLATRRERRDREAGGPGARSRGQRDGHVRAEPGRGQQGPRTHREGTRHVRRAPRGEDRAALRGSHR